VGNEEIQRIIEEIQAKQTVKDLREAGMCLAQGLKKIGFDRREAIEYTRGLMINNPAGPLLLLLVRRYWREA
jgi:hypothetical protein